MTEYQVTSWRDLPAMVATREGDQVTKAPLSSRFQEAIDEAAMRLGDTGSEAYLAGWTRGPWTPVEGPADVAADTLVAELEAAWPPERLAAYLDGLETP